MKKFKFFALTIICIGALVTFNSCSKETQAEQAKSKDTTENRGINDCNGATYAWCDGAGFIPPNVVQIVSSTYDPVTHQCCVVLRTLPNWHVTVKSGNPNGSLVPPSISNYTSNANGIVNSVCYSADSPCILVQMYYNGVLSCIELGSPCN
jgi:hypothetical protein